jgi:hypothetical protein
MTFLELRRAHAQMAYKEEMDFVEKNKEELIRQKEQAQEEGMKVRFFLFSIRFFLSFLMGMIFGLMLFVGNDGRWIVRDDV